MKTILATILSAAFAGAAFAQVPNLINYQGRLTDANGVPVTGTKNFSISIFDAATGGNLLYTEDIGAVMLDDNGVYSFRFGAGGTSNKQATETIGTTAGSSLTYTKTLSNTPIVENSITVTDGTNSWSQSVGNPGVGATATLSTVSGFVVGATITNGGSGYTSAPAVTITGNGSGATATATLTDGVVNGIEIGSAGRGYTGSPTISIAPPVIPFRVDYSGGAITATYATAPPAGRIITASYRYTDGSISSALATGSQHWMAISVSGLTQETRQRVLAVPFALNSQRAEVANSIPDGTVTADKLADGALRDASAREGNVLMTAQKRPDLEAEGFVLAGSLDLTTSRVGSEYAGLATYGGAAVWTGTEMIVWNGGNMPAPNPDSVVIKGGRYNPVTDTWAAISSTGEPRFSYSHTAVWAGTEMIVFGAGNNEVTNSIEFMGGRYNPVTDTWTTTSSTGAPTFSQYSNTAVWTGTEMIVYGEGNNSITNNREFTGGRYNPVTNTWTTISSTEAPTIGPDSGFTAVWTGTEMIVFGEGGYNGSGYNGIVGLRYNPVTNTWATMSSTDSPTLRGNLSAVWTGTEMVVLGKTSTSSLSYYFGSQIWGSRYNPATNTWAEISSNNSPNLLLGDGASPIPICSLWTGTEMIVLGSDYSGFLLGGRYDPVTNAWNVMSNPDFSEEFSDAGMQPTTTTTKAFWTGSAIIFYESGYNMSVSRRILIISPRQTFMYVKP
jgi:N-acetylneuraminic acid mutarotase